MRDAVATSLDTAGRAVWVSGLAVIVSLAVLIGCPVGILRSVAIGGVLATLTALVGALLLLPAVLAWLGPRVNLGAVGRSPEPTGPSPFWRRVGELSMRHPVATALALRRRADRDREPGAATCAACCPTRASSRTAPR